MHDMVYKHFRNMIGDTTTTNEQQMEGGDDERGAGGSNSRSRRLKSPSPLDVREKSFLTEFGKHVHKSGNVPTSSQQKSGKQFCLD